MSNTNANYANQQQQQRYQPEQKLTTPPHQEPNQQQQQQQHFQHTMYQQQQTIYSQHNHINSVNSNYIGNISPPLTQSASSSTSSSTTSQPASTSSLSSLASQPHHHQHHAQQHRYFQKHHYHQQPQQQQSQQYMAPHFDNINSNGKLQNMHGNAQQQQQMHQHMQQHFVDANSSTNMSNRNMTGLMSNGVQNSGNYHHNIINAESEMMLNGNVAHMRLNSIPHSDIDGSDAVPINSTHPMAGNNMMLAGVGAGVVSYKNNSINNNMRLNGRSQNINTMTGILFKKGLVD